MPKKGGINHIIPTKKHPPLLLMTSKGLNDPLGRQLFKANFHSGEADRALLISNDEYRVRDIPKELRKQLSYTLTEWKPGLSDTKTRYE